MERGALFLALLALLAPLAGCLGGGGGDEVKAADRGVPLTIEDDPLREATQETASADAPTWAVGDAWSLVPVGGEGEPAVLVVTKADADAYALSTSSEQLAGYDALHDVSYVGRIRASDLAGMQEGQPVQFFSFPLTDGKTWQATWDGKTITLTAKYVPALATSVGIHPGFAIEGMDGDAPYVKYDYVPMLRWWSHVSFASGYGFKVDRVHANWTGAYLTSETTTLVEKTTATPVASPFAETFKVDEGQSFVSVLLRGQSFYFTRVLLLVDPAGQPYPTTTPTGQTSAGALDVEERLPPTPGEWRVATPVAHHPDGAFSLLVRQVKLTSVAFP